MLDTVEETEIPSEDLFSAIPAIVMDKWDCGGKLVAQSIGRQGGRRQAYSFFRQPGEAEDHLPRPGVPERMKEQACFVVDPLFTFLRRTPDWHRRRRHS